MNQNNKKNIGLLLRDFNIIGGIERVATTLSNELSKYYNVYIIVYSDKNRLFNYSGELLTLDDGKNNNKFLSRISRSFKKISKIRKIIKNKKLDFIISFGEHPNILNIISRSTNKAILTIHSYKSKEESERRDLRGFFNKILIKFLYNRSDNIITVSKSLKDDLIFNFKIKEDKIVPIYNPFDIDDIKRKSEESPPNGFIKNNNEKILVSIGRICNTKAFWHLIRAFAEVKKEITNIKLFIIGEAFLDSEIKVKDKLLTLIDDLELKDDIRFIDFTNNPYSLLKNADIFVSSSILEGFGNVIVESLICGLPVIFPDCKAGPREILAPNTKNTELKDSFEFAEYGILAPVCDGKYKDSTIPLTKEEKLLSDAICVLLNNQSMQETYSNKGKIRALDFDVKKIIQEYLEALK